MGQTAGFGGAAVSIGVASETPSMNDLALDPTETRRPRQAAAAPAAGLGRIALVSALGLAGLGAFAGATSLMSGLVAPKPAAVVAVARQSAADWPDLKDGLPALAGSAPARIALPAAEPPAAEPPRPLAAAPEPQPAAPRPAPVQAAARTATPAALPAAVAAAPPPAPAIENAPVVAPPARQASVLPPSRTVATLPARPAETVRARTASTAFAALPPEPAVKPEAVKPEAAAPALDQTAAPAAPEAKPAVRSEKPEAKPEARPKPKPVQARKPAAVPTTVAAATAPEDPEETEVFGIRMPTLAATGRKIGAGVEAFGDAVKSLPDKF